MTSRQSSFLQMRQTVTENRRLSVTASTTRQVSNLFSPEELEGLRLNEVRAGRKELQGQLKAISNRINLVRLRERAQQRRKSQLQNKAASLSDSYNFKRFNHLIRYQQKQKKNFQLFKKAKQVEKFRITNHQKLMTIQQAVQERKKEESDRVREQKQLQWQRLNYSRDVARQTVKQQHETLNISKQRSRKKRELMVREKRQSLQHKLLEEAQIYEKEIQKYEKKIKEMRDMESKIQSQGKQVSAILMETKRNYEALRKS